MAITQANRSLKITTPFGKDALLLGQLTGHEHLSQLFSYQLSLFSESGDLDADKILGKDVTVEVKLPSGGGKRHFHGFVSRFSQGGFDRRLHEYEAEVRPWLWFLTRSADCRIFQNKSVLDIFEAVVKEYGFTDYKLPSGSYPPLAYCVQYCETDFNFVSRLLEREGIYYWFKHEDGRHTLMLANDGSALATAPGYDSVPYFPPGGESVRPRDHLSAWSFEANLQPGAYASTDYDFEAPTNSLAGVSSIAGKHARADYEIFDYPADIAKMDAGETKRVTKIRMQELRAQHFSGSGRGDVAGLSTGHKFKLTSYPRADLNIEYLVTGTSHTYTSDAHDAGRADTQMECAASIEGIDAKTPFRPQRITRKPLIHGTQTAIVVGPGGEEIYTDKYGRIKVQFHWDRYGKHDQDAGCFISVSQIWSGKNWGAMHIPRIGQEVIVSFLEGDPDRPIIVGTVPNGANMPPYDLPANMTQSGIKSRSSKGGSPANFNEIRFEDKKGSEQVFIHAEKNQDNEVENDETSWVGHDRTETVDHDESIHIKHDRKQVIDNDEGLQVGHDRASSVGNNDTVSVTKNRSMSVGQNESNSVGKDQTTSVSNNRALTIGGNQNTDIGKELTLNVGKKETRAVTEDRSTSIGANETLKVGKNFVLEAADAVQIKTGDASITMKKDGTIIIKGKDITIEGSGKINAKASGDVIIKGSKITQN